MKTAVKTEDKAKAESRTVVENSDIEKLASKDDKLVSKDDKETKIAANYLAIDSK